MWLDARLLVLVAVANGTPVVAKLLFGGRLSHPLDFGLRLCDGEPLFGTSKSIRGLCLALLATPAAAFLLGFDWRLGIPVALLAMAGDLCSSFLKRRLKLPSSTLVPALDQVPESLLPLLACAAILPLRAADIAVVVAAFLVLDLVSSYALAQWRPHGDGASHP